MKLWFVRSFVVACVCFIYWCFLGLISSEDWSIFQRATDVSWIVNEIAEEEVPSCSLRRIVKQEDSLKTKFSFSVPVLQWRDSYIYSHWQTLQSEPLPYGWKDQPFHEIGKTLSLLSHPGNSRLFERKTPDACLRCAVVGNGGILKGSGQGKVIDSHDYVFRVNGAVIKGFEDDVGTKTSFYGFTTNSLKNSIMAYYEDGFDQVPRDPGIGYIFIPAETRDYTMLSAAIQRVSVPSGPDKGVRASDIFGYNPEIHQFKMIHPSFVHYVTQRFLKSPQLDEFRDIYMPSTGALILLTALHTCDQVSAYGFITDNYMNYSDHYYDKVMKPLIFYANHDMMMEGCLWQQLHSHKLLWLYQRQETRK